MKYFSAATFRGGPKFRVDTLDFWHFEAVLEKEVVAQRVNGPLERFLATVGSQSDVASTPPVLWGPPVDLPPFGLYGPAAFFHDQAYRDTLMRWNGTAWEKASLSKDEADELFDCLMFALGVPEAQRLKLYEGVHLLGWRAFRDDRTQPTAVAPEVGI